MPVKSRKQFRLMKGIAEGTIKPKDKLTASVAKEMTAGQSQVGLPERRLYRSTPQRKRNWRFV